MYPSTVYVICRVTETSEADDLKTCWYFTFPTSKVECCAINVGAKELPSLIMA